LFGLIFLDDTVVHHAWSATEITYFDQFITQFFSPIVGARVRSEKPAARAQPSNAEIRVVRLAACGLSYKEVARRLGKSPNTVDNQLRSARLRTYVSTQSVPAPRALVFSLTGFRIQRWRPLSYPVSDWKNRRARRDRAHRFVPGFR